MTRREQLEEKFECALFGIDWDASVFATRMMRNEVPQAVDALRSARANLADAERFGAQLLEGKANAAQP